VLDAVDHIRESQIERERNHAKQEVAPWHGYTTNHYLNDREYCIQGMEADVIPSYHEDQSDVTQSRKRYEQSNRVAKVPASLRIAQ